MWKVCFAWHRNGFQQQYNIILSSFEPARAVYADIDRLEIMNLRLRSCIIYEILIYDILKSSVSLTDVHLCTHWISRTELRENEERCETMTEHDLIFLYLGLYFDVRIRYIWLEGSDILSDDIAEVRWGRRVAEDFSVVRLLWWQLASFFVYDFFHSQSSFFFLLFSSQTSKLHFYF